MCDMEALKKRLKYNKEEFLIVMHISIYLDLLKKALLKVKKYINCFQPLLHQILV